MTALVYEASLLKDSCGFESHHGHMNVICKCKYCNKEIHNQGALVIHERACLLNPNREKCKNRIGNHGKTKGYKGKNKYTKAKELGLPKPLMSKETKEKLSNSHKGKKLSQEHKQHVKEGLQHWKETHKEEFLNYSRSKSKSCENFKNYLRQNNIDFIEEYCPYPDERLYSLDIAWPDEKIAVEINGSQHYDNEGNLNESTLNKQKFFENHGWKIIQIYYRWCYGVINKNVQINSIFDLPIHNKEYVKEIYTRKYIKIQHQKLQQIIKDEQKQKIEEQHKQIIYNLINNSGIDFSKSGWSGKSYKYLLERGELWNKGVLRCIRKYYPEFLQREDVWKRKGSIYENAPIA